MNKLIQREQGQYRQYWIDVARCIAIVSITINHALSRSFNIYADTYEELQNFGVTMALVKSVLWVFSRMGVPLFLMVSGALLLSRDFSKKSGLSHFYKHNWLDLLITAEMWYAIMYCLLSFSSSSVLHTKGLKAAIISFFETLLFINQQTLGSMWYMPMILCVYMLIPIFACALKVYGRKCFSLPLLLAIFCGMVIPNINTTLNLMGCDKQVNIVFQISDIFSLYCIYLLLGYFIQERILETFSDRMINSLAIISFILTCLYQYWTYSTSGDYAMRYEFIGILISAGLLFEIVRRKANYLLMIRKIVVQLAKISFGIYFVHICIMTILDLLLYRMGTEHLVKFLILENISFGGSVVVIWATSKIGFVRKYLFRIKD